MDKTGRCPLDHMAKTNNVSNGGKGDQKPPPLQWEERSHKNTISSFAAEESDHEETSAKHTRRDRLQNWLVIFKDVKVVQVRHD